ncbi:TasA family protein [Cellulomonas sp. HD19AZ1]|uniref:TasA family protein n=1 Tax=Cellulomonas sp. HD19AZ1 TaxID=2559593 RepID=UPI00107156C7|nr:TasA family protein [Cellulomonas sp. HD19AZ1]TFH68122.1 hypothetical protein E4A51_17920 [Cellulomonas sp. HD19AZ1]
MTELTPLRDELTSSRRGRAATSPRPTLLRSTMRAVGGASRTPAAKIAAVSIALALVGGGVAGTSATFFDEARIDVNVAAGTLDINVDGQQGNPAPVDLPLPLAQFKPGDTTTKTVQVRNTGSLPAVVTTKMVGQSPDALGAWLDATLTAAPSGSPAVTSSGKANGGANLAPFTVPAGGQVPLTITLTLPERTPNTEQGKTDTLTLALSAAQE